MARKATWSKDRIEEVARSLGRKPVREDCGDSLPTLTTVQRYCGSLVQLQQTLGYEPNARTIARMAAAHGEGWTEAKVWDALRRLDICPSVKFLQSPRRPDWCPSMQIIRQHTGLELSEVQARLGWCPRGRGNQPGEAPGPGQDRLTAYYTSCRSPLNQ